MPESNETIVACPLILDLPASSNHRHRFDLNAHEMSCGFTKYICHGFYYAAKINGIRNQKRLNDSPPYFPFNWNRMFQLVKICTIHIRLRAHANKLFKMAQYPAMNQKNYFRKNNNGNRYLNQSELTKRSLCNLYPSHAYGISMI